MTFIELLQGAPKVLNIGVGEFAEAVRLQQAEVVEMRWAPPRTLDPEVERLLGELL